MEHQSLIKQYELLDTMMERMLLSAQQGDWDALYELELLYTNQVHLIKHTQENVVLSKTQQVQKLNLAQHILSNDAQLRALIQPRLHQLSKLIHGTQTEAKVSRAYNA